MSLSGQFGDKEKKDDREIIIEKFCELFSVKDIKRILGNLEQKFSNSVDRFDEKNPGLLDHKKYANFLYQIVGNNFLVNTKIGPKSSDRKNNRSFFLCALLIKERQKNKHLLNNIQEAFKRQRSPQEDSTHKCKRCKKTWDVDDKEYRLKISKNNIIKCIDNKCYTQKLEEQGLQFDDTRNLIHFFNILGTGNKEHYESIAICLGLPSSCAASVPGEKAPDEITVRPIARLNPLYDFQSEISQEIQGMLKKYEPDKSKAIVALPTGSGKTRLVVETLADWINSGKPGVSEYKRFILWIVERQELCWQAYNEFQNVFTNKGNDMNEIRLYPYWGKTSKRIQTIFEREGDVIVIASKDSLDRKTINEYRSDIRELGKRCSIVIIDEAHRATAQGYVRLQTALGFRKGKAHPDSTILLGLTATPFRGKKTSDLEKRFGNKILWPTLTDDVSSNQKPIPILEVQEEAIENKVVTIHGERSFDKDGIIAEYYWKILRLPEEIQDTTDHKLISFVDQFGNPELSPEFKKLYENAQESSSFLLDSETPKYAHLKKKKNIEFQFTEPGKYAIALEVSDDEGTRSQLPISHSIKILETPVEISPSDNPKQMQRLYRKLMEKKVLSHIHHRVLGYTGVEYENIVISEADYEDLSDDNIREMGEDPDRNDMIIEELRTLIVDEGKKSILFFGCSIEHSREIAIRLNALYGNQGIVAEDVHGDTNYKRRKEIVQQFKDQKINVLCNWGLFTTGFDVPKIDCVFIGRPTFSLLLYTQMIGRGLRGPKNKGTPDCLVVDTDEQYQNYIIDDNNVADDDDDPDEVDGSNENPDLAWRLFDDLWVGLEEKKYWYDGKFHETPPPDSIKIKKVNLQKKYIVSSKYEWKCKVCGTKGSTRNKDDRKRTSGKFGTNQKNITNDNPHGFNHKCTNCKYNEQKLLGEGLHLIKKYQEDGSLLAHQINRLNEFFTTFPEQIKKWQKAFEYLSEKLEVKKRKQNEDAKKRNEDDVGITFDTGTAFCSHCGKSFKEGNGQGSLTRHLAAVKAGK